MVWPDEKPVRGKFHPDCWRKDGAYPGFFLTAPNKRATRPNAMTTGTSLYSPALVAGRSNCRQDETQKRTLTSNQPTAQPVLTPISPGTMKLWLITNLPMRVVPERSNPMQARSLAYVGRMK